MLDFTNKIMALSAKNKVAFSLTDSYLGYEALNLWPTGPCKERPPRPT
jgi:hypothetical protein